MCIKSQKVWRGNNLNSSVRSPLCFSYNFCSPRRSGCASNKEIEIAIGTLEQVNNAFEAENKGKILSIAHILLS